MEKSLINGKYRLELKYVQHVFRPEIELYNVSYWVKFNKKVHAEWR